MAGQIYSYSFWGVCLTAFLIIAFGELNDQIIVRPIVGLCFPAIADLVGIRAIFNQMIS